MNKLTILFILFYGIAGAQVKVLYNTFNSKYLEYSTELKIQDNVSIFIKKNASKKVDVNGMELELSAVDETIFQLIAKDQCIMNKKVFDHQMVSSIWEVCNQWTWEITNEQKTILGYTAYKAVSPSKNIEAWFSPDIPISSGPYLYNGLPGIILEIINTRAKYRGSYLATEITLSPQEVPSPSTFGKIIPTDIILDARKLTKKYLKNIME